MYSFFCKIHINLKEGNAIARLEELVNELPHTELTPLVCNKLMTFYYNFTNDPKKSFFYHQLLVNKASSTFVIDKRSIVNLAQSIFRNENSIEKIMKIFETTKWYNEEKLDSYNIDMQEKWYQELINLVSKDLYPKLSSIQMESLIELIYRSKMLDRDFNLSSLVILKYLSENKLDPALKYFKYNIESFDLSLCEIIFIQHILENSKKSPQVMNYFKEILIILASKFGWEFTNNVVFYAYIMSGQFENAEKFYDNQLKQNLKLNILEKFADQLINCNMKFFEHRIKFKTNLKKFKLNQQQNNPHRENILEIILKLNKK